MFPQSKLQINITLDVRNIIILETSPQDLLQNGGYSLSLKAKLRSLQPTEAKFYIIDQTKEGSETYNRLSQLSALGLGD